MASICTRCALQLQRVAAAAANITHTSRASRTLSTTTTKRKNLPTFAETSNPELDQVLTSLREKHFIPRMLSSSERKVIFSMKTKQQVEEDPPTVTIGGEEVELKWIDQRTEIPNRQVLIKTALKLMDQGTSEDWYNLPALLSGLHQTKKTAYDRQFAKAIRLASNNGRFGTILQCLQQVERTGMSMKRPKVLDAVVWALRELGRGRDGGWSKESLEKAIRAAAQVGRLLEDEGHGSGSFLGAGDPRKRPDVLGVFLEMHTVYAFKYQDGEDVDGKVTAFAERLLSNMEGPEAPQTTSLSERFPEKEVLRSVPIWHGLSLSQRILGNKMPQPELATEVVNSLQEGLQIMVSKLESGKVEEGSYVAKALEVWVDCIRD